MKKLFATLLTLVMLLSLCTGCMVMMPERKVVKPDLKEEQKNSDTLLSEEEIAYVMIYNPEIYDEEDSYNELLTTGDFSDYVEAVISRADGLGGPASELRTLSVDEINEGVDLSGFDLSGGRGGAFIVPYQTGDTHEFYCGTTNREKQLFECKYAGEYCNIWSYDNQISESDAMQMANEFDSNIYNQMVSMFGEPRFADNGGKVNILFYPMEHGYGGFFINADLFASDEVTPSQITQYGINTDHAIININSDMLELNLDYAKSTLAHEFQHLICFTNYFETIQYTMMKTWLNEAMSGYVEEQLYPGAKDISGHFESFVSSNRIRHGQSMYNFETTTTNSEWDIGVYGSVYLFSEYLAALAGDDVFLEIHSYWRNSGSDTLSEAEAIKNSVAASVYDDIDGLLDYENAITFGSAEEEWMSKLVLDFYLSLLQPNSSAPKNYDKIEAQTLLYDEINAADIEGGGRVIVALKNGEFQFPTDADNGLVYIGLDKDFNIVTDFVVR
ncbi:MAG: hypothetical protein E7403_02595 [Ruminococcaceae bacterium]|nr:hypothetical protein [Oscillospiraceae bacterium]